MHPKRMEDIFPADFTASAHFASLEEKKRKAEQKYKERIEMQIPLLAKKIMDCLFVYSQADVNIWQYEKESVDSVCDALVARGFKVEIYGPLGNQCIKVWSEAQ